MRLLAIGAGLAAIRRIMQLVQQFFRVLPGLVEQRRVLRIADIGRRAGGIHNHGAAVAACRRIVVIVMRRFLAHTVQNHLVDLPQHLRRQALTEVHHQRRVKGWMLVVVAGVAAEILQIRVLLDHLSGFRIRKAVLRLDDAGSQRKPQRLCHVTLPVGKQGGVPLFDLQPGDSLRFFHPAVVFL